MGRQGDWPARTQFGECLKSLRERAGLSQPELAGKAGCNVFTVSKLERGLQEPAWPLVLALADALGVKLEAFRKPNRGRPAKAEATPKRQPKQTRKRKQPNLDSRAKG